MAAESYINVGNQGFFEGGAGLSDGPGLTVEDYCHPLVLDEPTLAVLRARLVVRAAALGWWVERRPMTPHLVVDGTVVGPEMEVDATMGRARFILPPGVNEVWLHSPAFVPHHLGLNADTRRLGMAVNAIRLENGLLFQRHVRVDDPALCVDFHSRDGDEARSWTTGRALLPAALWAGCPGALFLTVVFEPGHCCPTWQQAASVAPAVAAVPRLHLVQAA